MTLLQGLAAGIGALFGIALGLVTATLALGAVATWLIEARIEARNPPLGRFVAVEGGRLAVIEDGPSASPRGTVVLLHGASANASDPLEGFGHRLAAQGFRVLAFDRPGLGWSDRLSPEAGSPGFQARAIAQALDALGVGPVIVYGHSLGGAPALAMALERPERVTGLVLAAPAALPMPRRPLPWWARLALWPPATRLLAHTIAVPLGLYYLPGVSRSVFRPEPPAPDYLEASRAALVLRPGPALANIQDLAALPTALEVQAARYGDLDLPVTIVTGEADPIVEPKAQAVPLAARIPGARLVTLPGVGHMLHVTNPERIVAEIEALQTLIDARRR